MHGYSPFDKAINDLQPTDLAILKNVSEGWYVEYKSALISAHSLAKALSSFANTYGGWLFLGVKERGKDDSIAGDFPGIPDKEVDVGLQRLRHSASEHLNPTPFFVTKVLRGPCVEIGLPEGASVIAVEIPQSHTAPHIHKKGRIYRRVADGSEPTPETDRFALDQLWRRAEPIREMTRDWIKRDPEFSEAEEKVPYVRVLLCVDQWGQRNPWIGGMQLADIRSILNSNETDIPSVPFDSVHTTARGFIARQLKNNNPFNYTLTWMIRHDLSCDLVFPLQLYTPDSLEQLYIDLDGYDQKEHFIDILKEQGHTQLRIVDLNYMMSVLIGIVSKYRSLLRLADGGGEFFFKARVLNAWRILPFIDIETALDDCKANGLPMSMDSTVTIPIGDDPESFQQIPEPEIEDSKHTEGVVEKVISAVQAFRMFRPIMTAFGVPIQFREEDEGDDTYSELKAAGDRACTVQRNRNKKRFET